MNLLRQPLSGRSRVFYGIAGVLGAGAIGEVLIGTGLITAVGLPLPSVVVGHAGRLLADAEFLGEVLYTFEEWMLGLLIASIAGIAVGSLMGAFAIIARMLEVTVEVLRPLPSVAIGPLLVLLLGSGMLPLSLVVAFACLWPILFNAMYGVRAVDTVMLQTARTLHISSLGIVTTIRLPCALPFVFTGIRIAASIGIIVAVSAELLIGSGSGIGGYILLRSTSAAGLDTVYAATLLAGLLGVLVNAALALVDRWAFPWKTGLAQ